MMHNKLLPLLLMCFVTLSSGEDIIVKVSGNPVDDIAPLKKQGFVSFEPTLFGYSFSFLGLPRRFTTLNLEGVDVTDPSLTDSGAYYQGTRVEPKELSIDREAFSPVGVVDIKIPKAEKNGGSSKTILGNEINFYNMALQLKGAKCGFYIRGTFELNRNWWYLDNDYSKGQHVTVSKHLVTRFDTGHGPLESSWILSYTKVLGNAVPFMNMSIPSYTYDTTSLYAINKLEYKKDKLRLNVDHAFILHERCYREFYPQEDIYRGVKGLSNLKVDYDGVVFKPYLLQKFEIESAMGKATCANFDDINIINNLQVGTEIKYEKFRGNINLGLLHSSIAGTFPSYFLKLGLKDRFEAYITYKNMSKLPSLYQLLDSIYGNRNLLPEKYQSVNFDMSIPINTVKILFNSYYAYIDNFISFRSNEGRAYFDNIKNSNCYGASVGVSYKDNWLELSYLCEVYLGDRDFATPMVRSFSQIKLTYENFVLGCNLSVYGNRLVYPDKLEESYALLNMSFEYTIKNLKCYLQINNILHQKYLSPFGERNRGVSFYGGVEVII